MTYAQWITHVRNVLTQLDDGAIFPEEAFNSIVAKAKDVLRAQEDETRNRLVVLHDMFPGLSQAIIIQIDGLIQAARLEHQ